MVGWHEATGIANRALWFHLGRLSCEWKRVEAGDIVILAGDCGR